MSSLFQPGYLPNMTLAGNTFLGETAAAGVTIPAYNATAQVFGLWNPLGSGVECLLVSLDIGIPVPTTPVVGALSLNWLANAGSQIATGAPITAFTSGTPTNGRLGLGNASKVRFTPSAATTTAPVHLHDLGLSFTSTTPANGITYAHYDFNGIITVPPGNYVGIGDTTVQSGTTAQIGLVWIELPFTG